MKDLITVEQNNQRVLTTVQLAEVYGTDTNNIQVNFKNHKEKFIEGIHYYLLQGTDLKEFKNQLNDIQLVGKRAAQLHLWTERGANRHCKILDTNKAWQQFDVLEETYFKVKELPQFQIPQTYLEALEAHLNSEKKLALVEAEKQILLPKAERYDEFLDADGLTTMTLVGKHFLGGLTANKVAKFLQEKEVLFKKKVDDCYVPRHGYEKYFKQVQYIKRDDSGKPKMLGRCLKFNNEGIDLTISLFKGTLALN